MGKEEQELEQIWSYFKEQPDDIREKRQRITASLNENKLSAFPSTMLVTTAFDELFQCFSVGGQVKNYYRYGELLYCQKQREKLWFAIKHGSYFTEKPITETSSISEIENAEKIQEFYKKRHIEEKAKGSSEDVWDPREIPLNKPFKE